MLTVEVGDVHHIEIHEDEMTDTQPRQKNGKVGAKSAQTRNADTRLIQLSLNYPRRGVPPVRHAVVLWLKSWGILL